MHTSCTLCALRGHACKLTRLRFVPTRRRLVVARGRRAWRAKVGSPGHRRPVRLGAPCCIATHSELWAREVCALDHGLRTSESVGVGLRGVIFFIKTRVHVHEKGIFEAFFPRLALNRRSQRGFLGRGGARKKSPFFVQQHPSLFSA